MAVLALLTVALAPAGLASEAERGGARLVEKLKEIRPDLPVEAVLSTPLSDIFALELAGGSVLYGTSDGRYLFAGDMFEVGAQGLVNLAESRRADKRRAAMLKVPVEQMLVFTAAGERKAVINVFTDVDCGYCRKLHLEMADINAHGIEVRYLAFPRAGVGSRSYEKIVSAWCAHDRNTALTDLKLGKEIPDRVCPNPVSDQYDLGREIGVTGTPAIVLEDGRLLPGYMPADTLAAAIGL
ncbi:MAG: thioredoxin fold domain-containing protein [Pseudomonadales bacterium]|nr:thioredoxin fold domain-containing protein [Pseudomonadales bacterium]